MDRHGTIQLTRQDVERLRFMAEALAAQSRGIQKQLRIAALIYQPEASLL